jgi:hypothetical protein
MSGKFSAPTPKHKGIPVVHFKKLTCTACHSGSWPGRKTDRIKTSLAHGLGTRNVNKSERALPAIQSPVFAKTTDGKIAPHNLLWPAYWGRMKENGIAPIPPDTVRETLVSIAGVAFPANATDWLPLNREIISGILSLLSSQKSSDSKPVYLSGGILYQLDDHGNLNGSEHPAAQPFLWPIAHDVRPAVLSLGARGCEDCHSAESPFFFGDVNIDSPVASDKVAVRKMIAFQDLDPTYIKNLANSFRFRPWYKVVTTATAGLLLFVILIYGSKAIQRLIRCLAEPRD